MTKVTIELTPEMEAEIRHFYESNDTGWISKPHQVAQLVRDALPDEPKVGDVVTIRHDEMNEYEGETLLYVDADVYFTRAEGGHGPTHTYWDRPYWEAFTS